MRGSDVASLFDSAQWFSRRSVTDRYTDAWKNNVALAHLYHEGK